MRLINKKFFYNTEKVLFYTFVFSIPFQLRKILFIFSDRFIEWNSAFLYFTDLILFGIFALWIRRAIKEKRKIFEKTDILVLTFLFFVLFSLIVSQNRILGLYQFIKIGECVLLFIYVKHNSGVFRLETIAKIVIVSGFVQAILAIVQFLNQSSLGFKHFEAGIYNRYLPGVATFLVNGVRIVRAYGTLPHPNILAVFLLVSIFCLYYLWLTKKREKNKKTFFIILSVVYFVLVLALMFTFSRSVIFIFLAISLFLFLIKIISNSAKKRALELFILFLVIFSLNVIFLWPEIYARFLEVSPKEQAVTLRVYYNDIALEIIKKSPILGIGAGNFVWFLYQNFQFKETWLYQPVHNLFLLIASEIGISGLIFFILFLIQVIFYKIKTLGFKKIISNSFLLLFLSFLVLGLIDHYFWTIQQSRLLFWFVLGLLYSQGAFKEKS